MNGFLRRNPEFCKLWAAQVVSQTGDWLNKVAGLALISVYGGEGAALVGVGLWYGIEQALRLLPTTLLSPFAGPVADRVPRKLLLVGGDLLRALVVLAFLLVDTKEELPLVAVLIVLQMGLGNFFHAARQAALPNTVRREDLHTAIALSSATWSVMLSAGSLLGGALVYAFGTDVAFVADASTYLVSAALYLWLRLPPNPQQDEPFRWRELIGMRDAVRGWQHARGLGIAPGLLAKAFWGGAGGLLVLIALLARTRFSDPGDPRAFSFAFGALFAARGVGTAFGPFIARAAFGVEPAGLLRTIGVGFAVATVGSLAFGFSDSLWLAAAWLTFAHLGGGSIWVASTTIWQRTVDDRFRGRVHALDFLGMTLSFSVFGLATGWLFDRGVGLEVLTVLVAASIASLGAVWWLLSSRMRARAHEHGRVERRSLGTPTARAVEAGARAVER